MVDINIHRCTLRIVRHGGWSWGPEPRKLLQAAIKALSELLEAELAKLWADDVELEFAAPVSINVPLRMADLIAASGWSGAFNSTATTPELQALGQRIAAAASKAFAGEQRGFIAESEPETHASEDRELPLTQQQHEHGNAIFEVLRSWHNEGVLSQRLSAFSLTALQSWFDRLVENVTVTDPDNRHQQKLVTRASPRFGKNPWSRDPDLQRRQLESSSPEMIERLVEARVLALGKSLADPRARLRRRLMILTEVMVQLEIDQCPNALLAAVNRLLPLPDRADAGDESKTRVVSGDSEPNRADAGDQSNTSVVPGDSEPSRSSPAARTSEESGRIENTSADSESELRTAIGLNQKVTSAIQADSGVNGPDLSLTVLRQKVESEQSKTMTGQSGSANVSADRASEARRLPAQVKPHALSLQQEVTRPPLFPGVQARSGSESTHRAASALPFMLLGPLSRIGYLKALAATMEAADAVAASPLFAAAMAYKVLAPPARGWRREPDSISAATTFAGLNLAASEPALVQLARHLADHLSPLDAVIAGALIGGHNQQQPLLLLRVGEKTDEGFLLLDVEGALAIQWAAEVTELRQVLVQLDSSLVLIPQSSADAQLFRWLDDEGFHFVTDANPIRGEKWRSLRLQQERWWTNDAISSDTSIIKAARVMREAAEEASTIWDALVVQRPSVPLADDKRLDRHLALAASTALGTLAWELWRTREPTSPLLALERFRDFEALVTWKRDEVRVSLPLGKRFLDLRDHGLLDDVSDVPWFNGRTLVFSSD